MIVADYRSSNADGVRYLIETLLRNGQWEHVLLRQAARPESVDYGIVVNGSPFLVPYILSYDVACGDDYML